MSPPQYLNNEVFVTETENFDIENHTFMGTDQECDFQF